MPYCIDFVCNGQTLRYQGKGRGFAPAPRGERYEIREAATGALGSIKRSKVFAPGGQYAGHVPYLVDAATGQRVNASHWREVSEVEYRRRCEGDAELSREARLLEWRAAKGKRCTN